MALCKFVSNGELISVTPSTRSSHIIIIASQHKVPVNNHHLA